MTDWQQLSLAILDGHIATDEESLSLAQLQDTAALAEVAGELRDRGHRNVISYSRKVFIPLTHLCRDVCHYCTFAQTPKKIEQPYMPVEQVLELCRRGAWAGCQEALFTLGEKPELRYSTARKALAEMGYSSTLDYLRDVASRVLEETGLNLDPVDLIHSFISDDNETHCILMHPPTTLIPPVLGSDPEEDSLPLAERMLREVAWRLVDDVNHHPIIARVLIEAESRRRLVSSLNRNTD